MSAPNGVEARIIIIIIPASHPPVDGVEVVDAAAVGGREDDAGASVSRVSVSRASVGDGEDDAGASVSRAPVGHRERDDVAAASIAADQALMPPPPPPPPHAAPEASPEDDEEDEDNDADGADHDHGHAQFEISELVYEEISNSPAGKGEFD